MAGQPPVLFVSFTGIVVLFLMNSVEGAKFLTGYRKQCRVQPHLHHISQTDEFGNHCWDMVPMKICLGRCESVEQADWRFPYKRSVHPVCSHAAKQRKVHRLKHCIGADDLSSSEIPKHVEYYYYYDAVSCACQLCDSAFTSCEDFRLPVLRR